MMSPPKSCMVCGDKALGYNFNAVTCESCKAFFRRNALAKKQFTCPFSQNCEINLVTRRFCQKCRLKKCLDIGMKSENIMSEEDKVLKRRKIESNRAKRRSNAQHTENDGIRSSEDDFAADSSGISANETYANSYDSQSCGSFDSATGAGSNNSGFAGADALSSFADANTTVATMSSAEIVEIIVCDPDRASLAINKLMRTPAEALAALEKVIGCQQEALRLITHLIAYPGDALRIISKLMNSPFNALTVFTKFMSSPTDALEIITKIVNSPQDVLEFIRQLMQSPEDALDIMNKFMNTPAEALRIINESLMKNSALEMEQATVAIEPQQQTTTLVANGMDIDVVKNLQTKAKNALLNTELDSKPAEQAAKMATQTQAEAYKATLKESMPLELPSTSAAGLLLPPATNGFPAGLENANSMTNTLPEQLYTQMKTSEQSSTMTNSCSSSINSLDTVLTEVIRIEYEAYNALQQEPREKQDYEKLLQQQQIYQLAQETQIQTAICAPSSSHDGRELNQAELLKLRELKLASEALYYPIDDDVNELVMNDIKLKPQDNSQDPKLLQVINLTAVAIKRLIKMAKKISAFRDMCQEDQVALLKGGCTEMMIMRSVMTYDDSRNTWKIPHTKENMSNIHADILKLAKGNVYEEHLRFIRTFDEKWRLDENIILIMCAIVLFMPSRARVVHADVIKLEQNSYYYLLRRYLESIYPGCEAKSTFIKLIQKISDVERLNQFIIGVYLNVNPSQVEPLLREIFDLKNH